MVSFWWFGRRDREARSKGAIEKVAADPLVGRRDSGAQRRRSSRSPAMTSDGYTSDGYEVSGERRDGLEGVASAVHGGIDTPRVGPLLASVPGLLVSTGSPQGPPDQPQPSFAAARCNRQ